MGCVKRPICLLRVVQDGLGRTRARGVGMRQTDLRNKLQKKHGEQGVSSQCIEGTWEQRLKEDRGVWSRKYVKVAL